MIYTITFNPALDYMVQAEKFEIGKINRSKSETIVPGGKGLNVSRVLRNLGFDSTSLGFIAGFTGKELKRRIEEYGIKTDMIEVEEGITRINVKISSDIETALNANGPIITEKNIEQLIEKIEKFNSADTVILSGNIPKNLDNNIYERICKKLLDKKVRFIVDSSQELLINSLKYEPFLIKPNREELEETFNIKIQTKEQIMEYAKKLQEMGARNVLISLGGDGALLLTEENKTYSKRAPDGKVINTVGCGDSMVAGFVAGYEKNNNFEQALEMGLAAGSASAFSEELATKEEVDKLLTQMKF